ncbi:MAG: peptidylprolyl isomerase, partial [Deltaproteobacteria bacterium]|nr:peptidylprolyl isomerase [Deltaproteobacteria bacterium]
QMMRPNLVKQATENLINRHVLFQEADRQNIKPTPEEIDAEMNVIIGRFPSPAVFEQKLSQMGFTREKIIRDIEQQLKITALVKKSQADLNISITDPEVAAFYKDNPDNFKTPEQVRASHILMKMEAEDTEEIKKEKHHKLTELRSQIQGGADFAKLAQDNSDCPSKQQGGDLGFFERGKMVKPFADTAFTLKAGELSDIIETQFGYHLIKVAEHKAAGTTSLDEAKQKISDYLKLSKEQEAFQKYLSTLREATTVEYAETGAS